MNMSLVTQRTHKFTRGPIEGALIRNLKKFEDPRGWLIELFRMDELSPEFFPMMAYASLTKPGTQRGPHEHKDQTDYFCFFGPSNFRVVLWDNRKDSPTYGNKFAEIVGESQPSIVVIPPGIVHAYRNVGKIDGLVINCPNRLYAGEGKKEKVDEIRHEADPNTLFQMDEEIR